MGRAPENRRQALVKLLWIAIWMLYLGAPLDDLIHAGHGVPVTVIASLGLAAFVVGYLALVFLRTNTDEQDRWVYGALCALSALAVATSAAFGKPWLVLFVYVSVACGAVLPPRRSRWLIPAVTAVLAAIGSVVDNAGELFPALLIPCLLGGFAMVGIRQLVQTMRELREARETVAQLAATEERLRLARDLHDLLGHSLSLITLKSELAGRMLPDRPLDAAQQVSDIERVSRQALVDVREAVSGYRRPTLATELAGARTALAAAGVTADFPADLPVTVEQTLPSLAPDTEGALAWALREAITNVIRHSGATRCVITLAEEADDGGGTVSLTVTDNGHGPARSPGNGLTGLEERLLLAGGSLTAGPAAPTGFTLRASVPRRAPVATGPPVG
ncbi:sensor histidine kinase [Streptomyces sp. H10-C2]|uniref:sensor histidine kinase n=1 Tax=unclassified Streptomyces TaxID=2593676 RepID=UPI0024B9A7DE|nr:MULTISPECIES: sensor histidine kinase [unclassified Streptomyces]MDJ0343830.1 sensor histidine kinase [Streptomyces sp. PH10-H1]MDJ0373419.1 sensor histidine kinase [Streptomyces sp. H10-C2]